MVTVADLGPAPCGANLTATTHDPAEGMEAQPAAGVAVNEVASAPVTVAAVTRRAATPVFETVMFRAAEVARTFVFGNAIDAGVTAARGATERVVSENRSCSMFHRVSMPSAPPLLSTVMLPLAFAVTV
jgi:hypothetical protein